ncbi:MAG: ribosome-associated translation inhibitor RaiA [Nitrospinaceae bacterium]|nr:ribosome-associated translation inhibitor RaiA [Nitrospinaceae bacterium]NIR56589.1 ribosome-associated translation inhibitor RaiA [Nitrospinaceae bacterium]NIS87051.1 ribosome-associated translation inhibitor RaiA [Nitrospinaceae bacterium]NIT83895.1 ribosome-associated translation inhibitor RaiA [Nitrospinaceae bacterium]NIU46098.1 ribosome-associated translation inhibitor RaiA [Nitrospinaceae bacterium]
MKLTVTGRHLDITPAIKDHLNKKMDQTLQDLGEATDVHVALSVEKHRHYAEITVKTKGFSVHGEEENTDLYVAIANALNKVEKQLRKHKDRAKDLRIKKATAAKNKYTL